MEISVPAYFLAASTATSAAFLACAQAAPGESAMTDAAPSNSLLFNMPSSLFYLVHLAKPARKRARATALDAAFLISMDQHSSVHIDHCAGIIGGQFRSDKHIDVGHVRCCAEPAQRNALDDFALHGRSEFVARNVGLDETGGDAVDANAIRPELARHGFG